MATLTNYQNIINNKPIHLATVTPDGKPNLAVASDVRVMDADHLLISVNEMNHTQINLQQNPQIVITAFDQNWKGARIFGTAQFYSSGKYYDLCTKFFFSNGEVTPFGATKPKGAIIVTVQKVEKFI